MENLYVGIDVHFLGCSMPRNIKGFLIEDQGQYLIYINDGVSVDEQKKAIKHEIRHLINNDSRKEDDIEDIERRNR